MICSLDLAASLPQADTPVKLKGSLKQINWATTVRTDMLTKMGTETTLGPKWAATETLYRCLLACTDASWFIANRDKAWFEMNWDWLGLSDQQRAEAKAKGGRVDRRQDRQPEQEEFTERAERPERPASQPFLLSLRVKTAKGTVLKNVVTGRHPVDWLVERLQDKRLSEGDGEDVALVNAWAITPEQYQQLVRFL
jgi:hypothetical protein